MQRRFLRAQTTSDFRQAESLGLAQSPYRVLDEVWARHIGDIATLDYVIKPGILEGRSPEDTVLYAPPAGRIGNSGTSIARYEQGPLQHLPELKTEKH